MIRMHAAALAAAMMFMLAGRASGQEEAPQPASGARQPAATAGEVRVNKFMTYDAAAKSVALDITAALDHAQGGFNFNGGYNGNQTITVPQGWTVSAIVKNRDFIPHSAIIIAEQSPLPNEVETPDIPRAYTSQLKMNDGEDRMSFRASKPGKYFIYCGIAGHGPSGMYIRFVVSPDAQVPSYAM
jgi:sulfocyanin